VADADKEKSALGVTRDIVALGAIFLFFAGFVYRHFYLVDLGIRRTGDSPSFEFLISSWTVFQREPHVFLVPAFLIGLLFALRKPLEIRSLPFMHLWYRPVETGILAIIVLSASWMIFEAAAKTADTVARQTRLGKVSSAAEFVFAADVQEAYPTLERNSKNDELRILGRDETFLYILDQPNMRDASGDIPLAAATVYAIPHESIRSYRIIVP
jgi:hypothetical protein